MKHFVLSVILLPVFLLLACTDDSSSATDIFSNKDEPSRSSSSRSVKVSKANDESEENSSSSKACPEDDVYEYGYIGFSEGPAFDTIENKELRTWALMENGLELVRTDTLDCNAMVKVDTSLSGFYLVELRQNVEMSTKYYSFMRWINFRENMKTGIYRLDWPEYVNGFITENGVGIKGAKVRVLDVETETGVDGEFVLDEVPEGVSFMTVEYGGETRVYLVHSSRYPLYTEESVVNRINWDYGEYTMLNDFEDWSSMSIMPAAMFRLSGVLYFSTDSSYGGGSRFKGKELFAYEEKYRYDDSMGVCMYLDVDIDEETDNPFAIAGFRLGQDYRESDDGYEYFDISKAKSLSFEAKGNGRLSVQTFAYSALVTDEISPEGGIVVDSVWRTYSIPFDKIRSMLTEVSSINFVVQEDAQIFIDNIRLDGLNPTSWLKLARNDL